MNLEEKITCFDCGKAIDVRTYYQTHAGRCVAKQPKQKKSTNKNRMKQEHFITAGVSAFAVACYWMETINASALPLARENQIMSLIVICLMIVYLVMCLVVIRQKRLLKQICTHPRTSFDPLGWPTGEDLEVCEICGKSRTHWEQGESEWCDIGNIAQARRELEAVLENLSDIPKTENVNAFAIFIATMCKLERDHKKAQRQIARDSRLLQIA